MSLNILVTRATELIEEALVSRLAEGELRIMRLRRDPFREMRSLQAEMNEMFRQSIARFHSSPLMDPSADDAGYSLSLDVRELKDRYQLAWRGAKNLEVVRQWLAGWGEAYQVDLLAECTGCKQALESVGQGDVWCEPEAVG